MIEIIAIGVLTGTAFIWGYKKGRVAQRKRIMGADRYKLS